MNLQEACLYPKPFYVRVGLKPKAAKTAAARGAAGGALALLLAQQASQHFDIPYEVIRDITTTYKPAKARCPSSLDAEEETGVKMKHMQEMLMGEEETWQQVFSQMNRGHLVCFIVGMMADLLVDLYLAARRAIRRVVWLLDRWALQPLVRIRGQ